MIREAARAEARAAMESEIKRRVEVAVEERRVTWIGQAISQGVDSPVLLLLQQVLELIQQQQNMQATQLHFQELQEQHCREDQKLHKMMQQALGRISDLVARSMGSEMAPRGGVEVKMRQSSRPRGGWRIPGRNHTSQPFD